MKGRIGVLIITAYFEYLDQDTLNDDNVESVTVMIGGREYVPDITSSIGSE